LHLSSAVLPVGWGLGLIAPERLRLLLTVALAIAMLVEGARHLSASAGRAFDATFASLLRAHERSGITGATWLAIAMLGAMLAFPPGPAVVALWAVAAGDGAASIIGRLAAHRSAVPRAGKTIAGSLACALVTVIGALWLTDAKPLVALAIGVLTALAERPRGPLDDNLRVVAAAGIAAWAFGVA
jgi:dolichol kinase